MLQQSANPFLRLPDTHGPTIIFKVGGSDGVSLVILQDQRVMAQVDSKVSDQIGGTIGVRFSRLVK